MNGIDDLRGTLERHAEDLIDHGVHDRATDVHRRVRTVRRRRRAALAGVAAALVAVAGGVALLPDRGDGPDPAAVVVGVPAPAELTALGYRYTFTEAVEGREGRAVVKLPASLEPRLVTWATSASDQEVRVRVDSESTLSYDVPDFGDWVEIPAGVSQKVTVRAESGEPGLAVYTLSSERPDGVTKDGVTFRDQVAGAPLLGATIGDPGAASVTVDPGRGAPALDLRYFCAGGPENAYVHVALGEGELSSGEGCDDVVPADPTSYDAVVVPARPGAATDARLYVTRGPNGPLIEAPDLRIGLGVYAADEAPGTEEATFPSLVEEGRHLWRLTERHATAPGETRVEARVMDAGTPVLVMVGVNAENVSVLADFGHTEAGSYGTGTDVRGATFRELASPGTLVSARLGSIAGEDPGTMAPGDALVLAFYERAD